MSLRPPATHLSRLRIKTLLSYQHGYHAGNRADVLKHAVVHAALTQLVAARHKIFYVETHSGRGQYDLMGKQARKTGEAKDGVLAMMDGGAPRPLKPWLSTVTEAGVASYPGSPLLAASILTERDRMVLFEKHPQEYDALHNAVKDDPRIQAKRADGYSSALKLAPRAGETMCVLVDPSYETMADMDTLADWLPRALRRWPKAQILVWLPLFRDEREVEFGAYMTDLAEGYITGARWPVDPGKDTALEGTAMIAFRVSPAIGEAMTTIGSSLQSWWSTTP